MRDVTGVMATRSHIVTVFVTLIACLDHHLADVAHVFADPSIPTALLQAFDTAFHCLQHHLSV